MNGFFAARTVFRIYCEGEKKMRKLFTSESVTEGHPDKICDQISDAVLDALLEQDPDSRVACETCATTGLILVMGEITTKGYVPIADIVRKVVNEIGYDRAKKGFDGESCAVLTAVHDLSDEQRREVILNGYRLAASMTEEQTARRFLEDNHSR